MKSKKEKQSYVREKKHKSMKSKQIKYEQSAKSIKSGIVVQIPKSSKECDANWKALMNEINQTKKQTEFKYDSDKFKNKKRLNKDKSSAKNITELYTSQEVKDTEIWFDDIPQDEILAAEQDTKSNSDAMSTTSCSTDSVLVKPNAFSGLTKAVGIDCEMVGTGFHGSSSVLARVSIVNQYGKCIYDKHVRAQGKVTDYRTWVSGIRPSDLKGAEDFVVVQREVAEILKGRILVGHALHNDLKVLYLSHPKKFIRDTAEYKPFRAYNQGRAPALRILCSRILHVQVQKGEHSSVQDAQAAMKLYMMHKKQWEKDLKLSRMGRK